MKVKIRIRIFIALINEMINIFVITVAFAIIVVIIDVFVIIDAFVMIVAFVIISVIRDFKINLIIIKIKIESVITFITLIIN